MIIWDVSHLFRILPVINSVEWTVVFLMKTMLKWNHEVQRTTKSSTVLRVLSEPVGLHHCGMEEVWNKQGSSLSWPSNKIQDVNWWLRRRGTVPFKSIQDVSVHCSVHPPDSGSNWWIAEDGRPLWKLLLSAQRTCHQWPSDWCLQPVLSQRPPDSSWIECPTVGLVEGTSVEKGHISDPFWASWLWTEEELELSRGVTKAVPLTSYTHTFHTSPAFVCGWAGIRIWSQQA